MGNLERNQRQLKNMTKKILSQTLKHSATGPKDKTNGMSPNSSTKLKDILVTLGAATGILAGVLWMGGRFYAYGYFEQMNIPLYLLSFSTSEYAEVYATSVLASIISFISINIKNILIIFILAALVGITLRIIQTHNEQLKIREVVSRIEILNKKLLVLSFIAIFISSFFIAYKNGQTTANNNLINSQSVTVYSDKYLPLATTGPSNIYSITDLYLLTHNNGKYYFFKELDAISCKPKQVVIISDNELISVIIEKKSTVLSNCDVVLSP